MNNTYSTALPSGLERLKLALKAIPVKRILKIALSIIVLAFGILVVILQAFTAAAVDSNDEKESSDSNDDGDESGDIFIDRDTDEVHLVKSPSNYNLWTGR